MINFIYFRIIFLISLFIHPIHGHIESLPSYDPATSLFPYRIDIPRKILSINIPYRLFENLSSYHICGKFPGWGATTPAWDKKLNPSNLTLCSKDFGGDGNCLFHVISGILKENGYKISKFDFDRKDISQGIKVSIKGKNFNPNGYFEMRDIRYLSSLSYVGIDPFNKDAEKYLNRKQLEEKIQFSAYSTYLDIAKDVRWNPRDCLKRLQNNQDPLTVAKYVFEKLVSTNPVNSWGSGDDLYALAELLNVDFLLFHRNGEKIQHIMSSKKTPLCTLNLYYYDMAHFQGAGVVVNYISSNQRKLSSIYRHFELDEKLYDFLPKKTN